MALADALARLDRLDVGDTVQEFYFLRGPGGTGWAVHYRSADQKDWHVASADRLSDAIGVALGDDDDGMDLV